MTFSPLRSLFLLLALRSALTLADAQTSADVSALLTMPGDDVLARMVQSHVQFLSDDLLEGRATGQRGHELAARYAAAHFHRLGLEPAGDEGTFLQRFRLIESKNDLEKGEFHFTSGEGAKLQLSLPSDGLVVAAPGTTTVDLTASAVFVGYGVKATDFGHDDLSPVDLRGRIAVVLSGAPPWLPAEPRAHFTATKLEQLAKTGAVGIITLTTPRDERRRPWAFSINSARFPAMRIVEADGSVFQAFPELQARATLGLSGARTLCKALGVVFEEWVQKAEAGAIPAVPLAGTFRLAGRATVQKAETVNVLARLPGTNPALASQPFVITAHLDHIGLGPVVNGDALYNGTFDNAVGTSTVLTAAEQIARAGWRTERPILFALVSAEEKGLLGSNWLSRNPPAGVSTFAANINIDMPVFDRPKRDLVGWGGEHSTLGALLRDVASREGFIIHPDPAPDETIFVRSDQYSFVKQGVPALYVGTLPDVSEDGFRKSRYHKPSDDLQQPIDWPSIGAYARFVQALIQNVASAQPAPRWIEGDFFQKTFAP